MDVLTLLTFPKTSNAFSALRVTVVADDDGSSSPPHKTPRLDADSDSGSASRSTQKKREESTIKGPVRIQVNGAPLKQPSESAQSDAFRKLSRSIHILLTRKSTEPLQTSYEGIYSACRYVVCVSNTGEGLCGTLKMEVEKCILGLLQELVAGRGKTDLDLCGAPEKLEEECNQGIQWIELLVEICQWFNRQVSLLRSLLSYLDQLYVRQQSNLSSISDLCLESFNERIFENPQVIGRLRAGVQSWVTYERKIGIAHNMRKHISNLISQLHVFKLYNQTLEIYYIDTTQQFYTEESLEHAHALKEDPKAFFKNVNVRLVEEDERARELLPVGSWGLVRETTERALLKDRLGWLSTEALRLYMDARDIGNLSKMYSLFARVDGLKILCASFKYHVQKAVEKIVKNVALDDEMVPHLLDLKATVDATLTAAFVDNVVWPANSAPANSANDEAIAPPSVGPSEPMPQKQPNQEFAYAVTDAFTTGFKVRRIKPAEMIAKYLDHAMRKGQRNASDADFEAVLDSVLALYRYTDDKDVFRTFYHRFLAKRLLLERSASDDFEKSILKKLKEQYDPEFGMGEHMFKDLALSQELMRDFHKRLDDEIASGHKLSVMVLQRSNWPFVLRKKDVDLPLWMQQDLAKVTAFYKEKHQGYKLDWDHSLGTATLKAVFKNGTKELSVSLYQAVVLLLFNDSESWRFTEMKEQIGMEDGELRRTLQSLACGKKKVLRKVPAGRDVNDNDVFHFNADFTDARAKVHINSIQVKETVEESRRAEVAIEGDRKHYIDAAIVRIMKAKKELAFEQLKVATIDSVKGHFVPEVSMIKKRIEGLLEQEYLRRDEDDINLYIYVA